MKVTIEKQEKNVVQLNIEIAAEVATQEYNKAYRRINEYITVPGFRKGKAPRAMVEKQVGADQIKKEALDRLLPNVIADAASEHQFDIVAEPLIESFNFEVGQPLTVVVKLELKPEVNLNNYKGNVVEVPQFKNAEDAVQNELKALSERFATLEPVINRPAGDKDIVVMDFSGTVDGEPIKGGSAKNYQLDIANSNFIKGFAEQLVGKPLGEEFSINVTFPEDYHDKALAGKDAIFVVKINEIKEKNVPEINDELAQKVGPFQTLEELKADLTSYLEKVEKTENDNRAEKAITAKIIEQAQVELPDSMVNREAKILLEEVQERLKNQGISWEQVLDSQGHENIWNNLRDEASKRVKNSLVLGAVARVENLEVREDDFLEKVKDLSTMYNTDERSIFKQMAKNPGFAQTLSQQIMGQKIVKFLLDNNEVKYIEDTSKETQEV